MYFAVESLGNSNLGSLCSDFFDSVFFQPMIQKISYFHSFAVNTSRAGESKVSTGDRNKRLSGDWDTAWWEEREREVRASSFTPAREKHLDVWSFSQSHVGSGSCRLPPLPMALHPRKVRAPELKINKLVFFPPYCRAPSI